MYMKLIRLSALFVAGAVLVSGTTTQAQVSRSGGGYLFRMKFTKGQKMTYMMSMNTSASGMAQPMKTSVPMTMTVMSVQGNVATMKMTMGAVMGQKPRDITVKMDNTGKLVSGNMQGLNGVSATYPKNPVAVGGSWKNTTAFPLGPGGNLDSTTNYKFKSIKNVGGRQVAELYVTMTGKSQQFKMSGSGTMLILMADGSLWNTQITTDMDMAVEGKGNMKMKMGLSLVRK